jgi:hypothetical protein
MRSVAAAAVLLGAGLVAGHALADTVPVPVPTVSVPVPTVPVPVPKVTVPAPPVAVPVPKIPAPVDPAPTAGGSSTAPSAPDVASSVDSAAAAVGSILGSSAGASSSSRPSSAGSSGSSSGSRPEGLQIESLRSSRTWISTSGPKRRRGTSLTFVLPRDARVVLVVKQVSPTCRVAGQFSVQGHAGLNRVRFPGRAKHLQLEAGTYRISARTPAGRLLRRVTIVVVEGGTPSSSEVSSARAANVCTSASRLASTSAAAASTGASNTSLSVGHPSASSAPAQGTNTHSGAVLGTSVAKAARAIQPLLVALLALAIVLLALASLPLMAFPESRTSYLLARHRIEIAGLGAAAFAAVVIGFLLG